MKVPMSIFFSVSILGAIGASAARIGARLIPRNVGAAAGAAARPIATGGARAASGIASGFASIRMRTAGVISIFSVTGAHIWGVIQGGNPVADAISGLLSIFGVELANEFINLGLIAIFALLALFILMRVRGNRRIARGDY
ncbi:MAG: hypothetical protein FWD92_06205 [Methanomassiliicoccaceae archaeon]|nr:hypothetical protein [Methanomassiliicoccaceae archaeon]